MAMRNLPRNNRICTMEGCGERMKARGLCEPHYQRWKRHGDPLGGGVAPSKVGVDMSYGSPCCVDGCGRPSVAQRYCSAHYERLRKWGHPQTDVPVKDKSNKPANSRQGSPCRVPDCGKPIRCQNLCAAHYDRMRKYGDPLGGGPMRKPWREQIKGPCSVDGCDRPAMSRGYCPAHYHKWYVHGDPLHGGAALQRQNIAGRRVDPVLGYAMWRDATHPQATKNGQVLEHRAIMAEIIGRTLLTNEQVHHRNGKRDDNRPENLELWTSCQPSGQQPLDLISYAREILAMYPPEIEAKLVEMKQRSEADPEFARPSALTCEAEE